MEAAHRVRPSKSAKAKRPDVAGKDPNKMTDEELMKSAEQSAKAWQRRRLGGTARLRREQFQLAERRAARRKGEPPQAG
jgi:hypothetical protein